MPLQAMGNRTVTSMCIYINNEKLAAATEMSMENTTNTQVVKTCEGSVIQIGREDGRFTANFVIPTGYTGYSQLRNIMKGKGPGGKRTVQVQMGIVGDAFHVATCIIQSLSASSNVGDGSQTADITFEQIDEGEVIKAF